MSQRIFIPAVLLLASAANVAAFSSDPAIMPNGVAITTTVDAQLRRITYSWDFSAMPADYAQVAILAPGPLAVQWCVTDCVVGAGITEAVLSDTHNSVIQLNYEAASAPPRINSVQLFYNSNYIFTGEFIDGAPAVAGEAGNISVTYRDPPGGEESMLWAYTPVLQLDDQTNIAPVARAGADLMVRAGDTVSLDASGSFDANNDPLTYNWTLARPPGSSAVLSDSTAVYPGFPGDIIGVYTASLTVNDGAANSAPDIATITAVAGPPSAVTLIAPGECGSGSSPTYTWNAQVASTWYQLWINDSTGNIHNKWYRAAETNCSSGTGICSVCPPVPVNGNGVWWVRTWNVNGVGPWSTALAFSPQ